MCQFSAINRKTNELIFYNELEDKIEIKIN